MVSLNHKIDVENEKYGLNDNNNKSEILDRYREKSNSNMSSTNNNDKVFKKVKEIFNVAECIENTNFLSNYAREKIKKMS